MDPTETNNGSPANDSLAPDEYQNHGDEEGFVTQERAQQASCGPQSHNARSENRQEPFFSRQQPLHGPKYGYGQWYNQPHGLPAATPSPFQTSPYREGPIDQQQPQQFGVDSSQGLYPHSSSFGTVSPKELGHNSQAPIGHASFHAHNTHTIDRPQAIDRTHPAVDIAPAHFASSAMTRERVTRIPSAAEIRQTMHATIPGLPYPQATPSPPTSPNFHPEGSRHAQPGQLSRKRSRSSFDSPHEEGNSSVPFDVTSSTFPVPGSDFPRKRSRLAHESHNIPVGVDSSDHHGFAQSTQTSYGDHGTTTRNAVGFDSRPQFGIAQSSRTSYPYHGSTAPIPAGFGSRPISDIAHTRQTSYPDHGTNAPISGGFESRDHFDNAQSEQTSYPDHGKTTQEPDVQSQVEVANYLAADLPLNVDQRDEVRNAIDRITEEGGARFVANAQRNKKHS